MGSSSLSPPGYQSSLEIDCFRTGQLSRSALHTALITANFTNSPSPWSVYVESIKMVWVGGWVGGWVCNWVSVCTPVHWSEGLTWVSVSEPPRDHVCLHGIYVLV